MNAKTLIVGLWTVALFSSCGRAGKPGENIEVPLTDDQIKKEPTVALAPITNIGFETLRSTPPSPVGCAKPGAGPVLASLPADFSYYGGLARWPAETILWDDPIADAQSSIDIGKVYSAFSDQDLLIAIATNAVAANGHVFLEFGGVRVKDGNMDAKVVREFRLGASGIDERVGSQWSPLAAPAGQVHADSGTLEARLSMRLVADIMNWPAWWIRVSSQTPDEMSSDSTSSRYFPSLLNGDEERLGFSTCTGWGNDRAPFSFTEITDRRVRDLYPTDSTVPGSSGVPGAPGGATGPTLQDDAPPVLWDFNSLGLVRRAYDNVVALIGYQSLGVDSLTIITSLKTGDYAKGHAVDSNDSARFGYIFAESRRLANAATDTAAFEEIFASAAVQLLRIHGKASGHQSPGWLQEAYASALHLHLMDTTVGRIFVLNQFRTVVEPFLANIATDVPLRSEGEQASSAFLNAKAVAFSHLIWAYFDSKTIVAAWRAALSPIGSNLNPDEVFRRALIEAADANFPGRKNKELVDRIWTGWVLPGEYDASMSPGSFLDRDKDGLADFLEIALGYSPERADTDLDGWTDLVSYVRSSAGKSPTTFAAIVADGSFDDWTRLMPQRINLHRGQSGACPEPANITHFGALASTTGVLIGAHSDGFPKSGAVRWEALVDFPVIKRQLLLTNDGSGFDVVVSDVQSKRQLKKYTNPRSQGTQSIEWAVNFAELGLDPNLIKIALKNSISSRLRTVYKVDGVESYCDETNWFEANVVQ